jgi:hypothetical protein
MKPTMQWEGSEEFTHGVAKVSCGEGTHTVVLDTFFDALSLHNFLGAVYLSGYREGQLSVQRAVNQVIEKETGA